MSSTIGSTKSWQNREDFLAIGYDNIQEPLNLKVRGRAWFHRKFGEQVATRLQRGLVLGATDWLAAMLHERGGRVTLMDRSEAMLSHARATLGGADAFEYLRDGWLSLTSLPHTFDAIVGDNSFLFMRFPEQWIELTEALAARLSSSGVIALRYISVPPGHRSASLEEVVEAFLARDEINYTELRTTLLLRHWDRATFAIKPEKTLGDFEAHRPLFQRLFDKWPLRPDNDLVTVEKYRNSGASYYVPPLDDILALLDESFRVTGVHFGPYALSRYFPLIVAERR